MSLALNLKNFYIRVSLKPQGMRKESSYLPFSSDPKKDGSFWLILNLKRHNIHVEYQHFKMDTLGSAINMMRPNCYMASVDLKDVYSVPIAYCDKKYLKFEWMGQFYKFTCLPNGLAFCPSEIYKTIKTSLCYFEAVWSLILLYR